MSIKKFIENVKESLGLDEFENRGKKKSIKRLLEKLRSRKEILDKTPRRNLNKKELKALKEEKDIVSLQIKKGEKLLDALHPKNQEIPENKKLQKIKKEK